MNTEKNKIMNNIFNVSFAFVASALLLSCGTQEEAPAGVATLDETLACPDGYVGYSFGERPLDTRSEYYQEQLGDDYEPDLVEYREITLTGLSCGLGSNKAEYSESALAGIKALVDGKPIANLWERYCPRHSTMTATWTCTGDTEEKEHRFALTRGSRGLRNYWGMELNCGGAEATQFKRAQAERGKTICVPEYCTGMNVRDTSLNCVPREKTVVSNEFTSSTATYPTIREAYQSSGNARNVAIREFYPNRVIAVQPTGTYAFWTEVGFRTDYGYSAPPEGTGLTYWFADQYIPVGADLAAAQRDPFVAGSVYAFRCIAGKHDVNTGFNKMAQLSPECFEESQVLKDLRLQTKLAAPLESYQKVATRIRVSFDVVGKTIFVGPGSSSYYTPPEGCERDTIGNSLEAVDTCEREKWTELHCAPNPPEFFYETGVDDAGESVSGYNTLKFLEQRLVKRWSKNVALFVESRAITVGAKELTLGATAIETGGMRTGVALEVTDHPVNSPTLPVDFTWFLANDSNPNNPYSIRGPCAIADNGWSSGGQGTCNFSPPDLKAGIYIWPTDATVFHARWPKIGEIPLTADEVLPQGTSEQLDLRLTSAVRKRFYDSTSQLYIPPSMPTRSFEVIACIEASNAGQTIEVRDFMPNYETARKTSLRQSNPFWAMYVSDEYSAGFKKSPFYDSGGGPVPTGCAYSDVPLLITADWLQRPVTPVGTSSYEGDTSDTGSGNGDMSSNQDNDNEITCKDTGQQNCTEAANAGNTSDGEGGRSIFNIDANVKHHSGNKVSIDLALELFGYKVLKPDDEDMDTGWPTSSQLALPGASTPVTVAITPDLEPIATKLNMLAGGTNVEWEANKRYGGKMGLGVGIGYKTPFQIGPIPGLVTIAVSAGVAIEFSLEMQFAPSRDETDITEDEAYPCEVSNDTDCVVVINEAKSFQEAQDICVAKGGRLGEMGTLAEAQRVSTALLNDNTPHWIGAQAAYQFNNRSCASSWNTANCIGTTDTSYRWLSSDDEFARVTGSGAAPYTAGKKFVAASSALYSPAPTNSGLTYTPTTKALTPTAMTEEHPFTCVFDYADDVDFFAWKIGLEFSAAGGLSLSFCSPSDEIGICLGGTMNIIVVTIGAEWSNQYHWLYRDSVIYGKRGATGFEVPWGITLMEGELTATAQAGPFSVSWNILYFEGFSIADGKLFEWSNPIMVNY